MGWREKRKLERMEKMMREADEQAKRGRHVAKCSCPAVSDSNGLYVANLTCALHGLGAERAQR